MVTARSGRIDGLKKMTPQGLEPPGGRRWLGLSHHLGLEEARGGAERSDQPFADDAVVRLHRLSSGIPRALNNAATAALIAAAGDGKGLVDDACAKKAVAELTRE